MAIRPKWLDEPPWVHTDPDPAKEHRAENREIESVRLQREAVRAAVRSTRIAAAALAVSIAALTVGVAAWIAG